ncbi:6539_t:CDS:2 [Paraglomus brasilianum]|uniref:6539_t:CDS:1 n=1 Tax=Paraglomus brasilianum TaxID=144538 RepID=A0A9N9GH59_9GLOM|nr:6539_t:CDS:2 [Paraglomus brasilianum]
MQVTRLQFGVYSNQQPFCLYLFPLVATSLDTNSSPTQPIYQPFYRLRDIDAIFFNASVGYIYDSGHIPHVYFDTPGYCFYERSGDVYLSSRALNETALRMGNMLLAEFCKLSRDEIRAGAADRLLKKAKVPIIKSLYVEAEFEFVAIDSRTRKRSQGGRISIADVLDNDDANDRYETRIASPTSRIEFNAAPIVKQEPSPANSTPSSPDQTLRSTRSSSPVSSVTDDDNSRRKRRRVIPSAITKTTNNPEAMERVRNNLKLKQQKSVGEVRQNRLMQESIVDRRHSVAVAGYNAHSSSNFPAAWDPNRHLNTKRHSISQHRVNRNSKNLSLYSPPRVNRSASASGSSDNNSPIHTSMTAGHRASVSGYPSQSAFSSACRQSNQSQTVHPASRSASIHGLISSDCHNASRPVPNIQVTPSTAPHAPSSTLPRRESLASNSPAPSSDRSKDSFIQVFDTFYDAVADTHSLKNTLEEQIRKTSALLQTLQSSGLMIESLVRGQVREMQREVISDLTSIEKRVARVEERMNCVTSSPPLDCDRRLSEISTVSSDSGYSGSSKSAMSPRTPEAFSRRESQDVPKKDYENVLTQLKARLESLERRMSVA